MKRDFAALGLLSMMLLVSFGVIVLPAAVVLAGIGWVCVVCFRVISRGIDRASKARLP